MGSGCFSSSAALICTTIFVGSSSFDFFIDAFFEDFSLYSGDRSGVPLAFLPSLSLAIGLFLLFYEVSFSFLCSDAGASATFPSFKAFLAFGAFLVADLRSFHIGGVDSLAPASSL